MRARSTSRKLPKTPLTPPRREAAAATWSPTTARVASTPSSSSPRATRPASLWADVTFLKGGYGIGVKLIGTFPELERSARTRRPREATSPSSSPSR